MKNTIKILIFIPTISISSLLFPGCKKLVDVELPVDKITRQTTFSENATSIGFVTSTYAKIGNQVIGDFLSLSFLAGLSADEFRVLDAQTFQIYQSCYRNQLTSTGTSMPEYWDTFYNYIYNANTAIEGISKSETLTPSIKQYLLGEAKFQRAYWHFYLVNLYGDIPIVTSTDWRTNSNIERSLKDKVYDQIILDLKEAKNLLPSNYLAGDLKTVSLDRVRPTKWAALAMLSRVYLYNKQYAESDEAASEVINNTLFSMPILSDVFLRNSKETIWSIQPTDGSRNTQEAQRMLLTGAPTTDVIKPFFLNPDFVNAFEPGDPRKAAWTNNFTFGTTTYYGAAKYKALSTSGSQTEYSVLLRLAEVYLNRAEARIRLGGPSNIANGIADLNEVRKRARGVFALTVLPDYPSNITQLDAIKACLKERRFELFTELGHRWFDLKRTDTIDEVMSNAVIGKNTSWNPNWALYPIWDIDIQRNPSLAGKQNPGY